MVNALVHLTYFPTFHQKSSPHTKDLVHVSTNHCAIYHSQKVLHEIFLFLDGNMFLWNEYLSYACNNGKQYLKICCDFKKWFVFKNINKINKYLNRKIKHIYIYQEWITKTINEQINSIYIHSMYIYTQYVYIYMYSINNQWWYMWQKKHITVSVLYMWFFVLFMYVHLM